MLHFFIVHSSLTNAIARKVVEKEQLPLDKVCFVLSRSYVLPDDKYQSVKLPFTHYPVEYFPVQIAFWKNWSKIKEFDQFIDRICEQQPFYWYADHSYNTQFYLTTSHPQCKGYYFIEEGVSAYYRPEKWAVKKSTNPFRGLLYWLNFGKRNKANRHFFDLNAGNYLGCFGVTQESFGAMPNKKIMGIPFLTRTFEEEYPCILIHDAMYEELKPEVYLKWVRMMTLHALSLGFKRITQKYHPGQRSETIQIIQEEVLKLIGDKATLITLDSTISLEEIAFSQKPTMYLVMSSVGIYAHIAGAKIISLIKVFCADLPEMEERMDGLFPDFYSNNIEYL